MWLARCMYLSPSVVLDAAWRFQEGVMTLHELPVPVEAAGILAAAPAFCLAAGGQGEPAFCGARRCQGGRPLYQAQEYAHRAIRRSSAPSRTRSTTRASELCTAYPVMCPISVCGVYLLCGVFSAGVRFIRASRADADPCVLG